MRKTPAQIAVQLICGKRPGPSSRTADDFCERLRQGRDWLVRLTGKDFGYDLQAWHNHLKESREGGYTFGRNLVLPKVMEHALASSKWQAAVQQLTEH